MAWIISLDALMANHVSLAAPTAEELEASRDDWVRPDDGAVQDALDLLARASPIEADILEMTLRGCPKSRSQRSSVPRGLKR